MINIIKNIWRDPVWSKVISSIIIGLFAIFAAEEYFGSLFKNSIASYILIYFGIFVSYAWNFLTEKQSIPMWFLIIMILNLFLTIIFMTLLIVQPYLKKKESYFFDQYFLDEFEDVRWRWKYSGRMITNLIPYCVRCDMQIVPMNISEYRFNKIYEYRCDNCRFLCTTVSEPIDFFEHRVRRHIELKIRNGSWQSINT